MLRSDNYAVLGIVNCKFVNNAFKYVLKYDKIFLILGRKSKLRVISGDKKGHRLKAPKGMDVRPTEDKIKESIFNIIRPLKMDAIVLDLFAGSGSIGIEFLSRGANKAYFVDLSQKSIDVIKENISHTKLDEKALVLKMDANRALIKFSGDNLKFDYIYIDPPFNNHQLYYKVINLIDQYNLLVSNGVLLVEHDKELILEEKSNNLNKYDFRNYGSKSISFFRKQEV